MKSPNFEIIRNLKIRKGDWFPRGSGRRTALPQATARAMAARGPGGNSSIELTRCRGI
jgi:hypothetical protein